MNEEFEVQPLPQRERRNFFLLLVSLFVVTLPFLFLYAAGYRFDFGKESPFIPTGGLYVASERTGAEIYIDNELVRETRTFRKAFYAQGLEPGTHRVHVQKEGHNTWVKELPVYAHLVTEAQAFNMPLVPQVRTISSWKNAAGDTVLFEESSVVASSSNPLFIATTTSTRGLIPDTEYATLVRLFADATSTDETAETERVPLFSAPLQEDGPGAATTTKLWNGVRLAENEGDVFATFVGSREQMPYYYCAEDFEFSENPFTETKTPGKEEESEPALLGPVQYVPEDAVCEPVIRIDRKDEKVSSFDFYPNSSDLVLMGLESGIYVVEVDNRSWQNVQPILLGENLAFRVQNGTIYIYDGSLIYQVFIEA